MRGRYQAYPEYKDSGVEWLEKIPEHWDSSKLRYMFSFSKGLTITKENLLDEGVPCVNYGEVHSKYGFEVDPAVHPLKCVNEHYLKSSQSSLLSKGDMVFADTSEDIEGSGNFTQLTSDQVTFAGYHTIIARPNDKPSSRFYAYLIDSQEIRAQIRYAVKGVKVFSITQAILRAVDIWLPTFEERTKIANFLDHETAKIDTLIEKQQQLIKLLKEKRQAVISHAVTKGLNPDAPMRDSGVEWLGEVPGHWAVLKMSYLAERICVGFVGSIEKFYTDESGVPLLKTTNVTFRGIDTSNLSYVTQEFDQANTKSHVLPGDVVIARHGESGRSAVIPEEISYANCLNIVVLRVSEMMNGKYYSEILNSVQCQGHLKAIQGGSVMGVINTSDISELLVPLPPMAEQNELVQRIQKRSTEIDLLVAKARSAIVLLNERRTALISAAVTGKIDVRDWVAPEQQTNKEDAA